MSTPEFEELKKKVERLQRDKVDMSKKLVEIQMMNETFRDINSTLNLDEVLEKIIARVTYCIEAEIGSVMFIDEGSNELYVAAAAGIPEDVMKSVRVAVGQGISGWVAEKGEPLLVEDIESDPRFGKKKSDSKYNTKSLISTPLVKRGKIIGVLNVNNKLNNQPFTEADLDLLTNIANQAAIAIENARLYEQTRKMP
ncbi:GAF domain-containing protein [Planctomycetota bacterium]